MFVSLPFLIVSYNSKLSSSKLSTYYFNSVTFFVFHVMFYFCYLFLSYPFIYTNHFLSRNEKKPFFDHLHSWLQANTLFRREKRLQMCNALPKKSLWFLWAQVAFICYEHLNTFHAHSWSVIREQFRKNKTWELHISSSPFNLELIMFLPADSFLDFSITSHKILKWKYQKFWEILCLISWDNQKIKSSTNNGSFEAERFLRGNS